MRHWALPAAIGVVVLSAGAGSASPVRGVVSGIYDRDQARSDDAFQAIDRSVVDISEARRPIARMRLRKSIAVSRIRLSIAGDRVGIAYDAKAPIVVWLGGEPVAWKLTDQLVFDVSAKANGDAISLTFRGDDGERTTTYRSVGQDLVEDTSIVSPLFPKPITYRMVYGRAN